MGIDDDTKVELTRRAGAVLDANWLGRSTKPAPRLYPHQWSWDSAFIAIGNAHRRWDRARVELLSLFEAQWSNGMVPHIVFAADVPDYFPSAADWGSRECPGAPTRIGTSGLCQPPVHALAARRVYEARPDSQGRALLRDLFEPLRRWHAYLFEHRRIDSELVEIWHPWESGMDNSPAWDTPLSNIRVDPDKIPGYRRVDTSLVDPADRPTDAEYDRYMYLVARLRDEHYSPAAPAEHPFRIRDVLFNAALVRAERDLAVIADVLGEDGTHERRRAASLAAAIDRELWSDDFGMHLSFDVVAGDQIRVPIAGGLVALIAEPEPALRTRLITTLADHFLQPAPDDAVVMTTVPATDTLFEPRLYWRGPVWVQMSWLVIEGLELSGHTELALRMRRGVVGLIEHAGFAEYFDPIARTAHGADDFSWSASLLIDLLAREAG